MRRKVRNALRFVALSSLALAVRAGDVTVANPLAADDVLAPSISWQSGLDIEPVSSPFEAAPLADGQDSVDDATARLAPRRARDASVSAPPTASVPEPSDFALLLVGVVGGVAFMQTRRRDGE